MMDALLRIERVHIGLLVLNSQNANSFKRKEKRSHLPTNLYRYWNHEGYLSDMSIHETKKGRRTGKKQDYPLMNQTL
jgi:hypothetical protein